VSVFALLCSGLMMDGWDVLRRWNRTSWRWMVCMAMAYEGMWELHMNMVRDACLLALLAEPERGAA
jgi:hypothetical protein